MWHINEKGEKEFTGGRDNWKEAEISAADCPNFKLDEEVELFSEETVSCYNCRYRRWNLRSFTCCKEGF